MAVVMPAETSPFDANPEQTPSVTKEEMKSQFNSSEVPIKMVENATVYRPGSRKKNVSNFPVLIYKVNSWQKFEDAYVKGQTNDHLHYIFEQMKVTERLGKGVFQLKSSIHLMPRCDTKTGEWIPPLKEKLNRIWRVYLEELDVKPLAEKIGEKMLDNTPRKENAEFLLKRLFNSKGINAGLKILKDFCAAEYTYIMEESNNIMGKRAEDESLLGQELFTADITLDTNMTGKLHQNILNRCRLVLLRDLDVAALCMNKHDYIVCHISNLKRKINFSSGMTYLVKIMLPEMNSKLTSVVLKAPSILEKKTEKSSVAEKQVVQALRTATGRHDFSSQAKKHLGLEFRDAHNGSIIIRFSPKVGKSLQKLKQSCATGKIKEFLPSIFMQSGVEHTLGEGDFSWKFYIYKTCRPIYFSEQETTSPVVRMVNEEDVIKDHWKLFVEEIDPWPLLGDLQMKGIVGEEDGDKMLKLDSRKDSVKFLLERLQASEEPDLGYEILLDHCREHNDYLYQKILVTEGLQECCGYVEKRTETERCQSEREMLFTATVILCIHRKEKKSKEYGSHVKLEISHLTIQEPVCYFDIEAEAPEEESDAVDLQKEVVMVLEQIL